MSKENTSFRKNLSKCLFNDCGFCKYKENCSKQHFLEKCREENCDKQCTKRHPKPCKNGQSCSFNRKQICAYDHEVIENDSFSKLEKKVNTNENTLKELKDLKGICERQSIDIEELKQETKTKQNK